VVVVAIIDVPQPTTKAMSLTVIDVCSLRATLPERREQKQCRKIETSMNSDDADNNISLPHESKSEDKKDALSNTFGGPNDHCHIRINSQCAVFLYTNHSSCTCQQGIKNSLHIIPHDNVLKSCSIIQLLK
jgi:hypothetical protein